MQWVKQSIVSTDNDKNRSRVAWLEPLSGTIREAITAYYARDPEGDAVTLAVFDAVSWERIQALPNSRDEDAARRDLGMRVPLELVDMFGAHRVETWRKRNGRSASPRRAHREWPRNYTPHKVVPLRAEPGLETAVGFGDDFEHQPLWHRVFASWFDALSAYHDDARDRGWWYNEAANVSFLAGAVWRIGGTAISEYHVTRRGGSRPGRGDLWFALDGNSADLECKLAWPATDQTFAGDLVNERLAAATWQLGRVVAGERANHRYAACFVVASPYDTEDATDPAAILDAVVNGVDDGRTAWARYEPRGDELAERVWDGVRYPAVMLVVRRVD
jgi:hypothetical protein